jgi:hypothetical protein
MHFTFLGSIKNNPRRRNICPLISSPNRGSWAKPAHGLVLFCSVTRPGNAKGRAVRYYNRFQEQSRL